MSFNSGYITDCGASLISFTVASLIGNPLLLLGRLLGRLIGPRARGAAAVLALAGSAPQYLILVFSRCSGTDFGRWFALKAGLFEVLMLAALILPSVVAATSFAFLLSSTRAAAAAPLMDR